MLATLTEILTASTARAMIFATTHNQKIAQLNLYSYNSLYGEALLKLQHFSRKYLTSRILFELPIQTYIKA